MDTRYLLIGSAALALAGAAAAAPVKPQEQDPNARPAQVVLASAEQVQPEVRAAQPDAAKPAKRPRAARVTSCRCAGQNGTPEQADQ